MATARAAAPRNTPSRASVAPAASSARASSAALLQAKDWAAERRSVEGVRHRSDLLPLDASAAARLLRLVPVASAPLSWPPSWSPHRRSREAPRGCPRRSAATRPSARSPDGPHRRSSRGRGPTASRRAHDGTASRPRRVASPRLPPVEWRSVRSPRRTPP